MRSATLNRFSGKAILALSVLALLTVCAGYVAGYFTPPQPDEGALAHIFQLSIVAIAPMLLLFLLSADWKRPARAARALTMPCLALLCAFVALYFLEHR